jgi:hypothetical protein
MHTRELIALSSGLLLLACAGYLVLSGTPADAGDRMPAPVVEIGEPPPHRPDAIDAPVTAELQPTIAQDGVFHRSEGVDTTGWTSGIIKGDLLIASSVLPRVQAVTILVEELRNAVGPQTEPRPWHHAQAVDLGESTPTFEIRNVPFSKYGYLVRAYAPGLNGGQQTINITDQHPCEDAVRLSVAPGTPYSLLLRDQDQLPVTDTKVSMTPVGDPPGRASQEGTTDNFGSVVFNDVLAGDYLIYVGHPAQPLIQPPTVTVQSAAAGVIYRNGQVQCQGSTVTVPRGVSFSVYVRDTNLGYGIGDVTVKLMRTDSVQGKTVETTTDFGGHATLEHLVPGVWQIDVYKDAYERRSAQVTIKDREEPPQREFTLARIR